MPADDLIVTIFKSRANNFIANIFFESASSRADTNIDCASFEARSRIELRDFGFDNLKFKRFTDLCHCHELYANSSS